MPKLFSDHPIEHLTADVAPRNSALRLLHNLGFVITRRAERTFLLGDEWCDSVYLELPRAAGLDPLGSYATLERRQHKA